MAPGGWVVLAAWICAAAYWRPGFRGRRLVGRIRCFFLRKKAVPFGLRPLRGNGLRARGLGAAKGSGLGRLTHRPPDLTHGAGSVLGSTLIYYQRVPTDGARRLGCAGILDLCCRLPASGLWRPEARWPDKVLFSAEKSRALRAKAASRRMPHGGRLGTSLVPPAEPFGQMACGLWCLRRSRFAANGLRAGGWG
jgi:hypothetical protein